MMKLTTTSYLLFISGLCSFTLGSSDFHLVEMLKTYDQAKAYCREMYTDLATVNNSTDMMNLLAVVSNVSTITRAWIGLEIGDGRMWHWSRPGQKLDFFNWKAGEPKNLDEDTCAAMDQEGEWFESGCTAKRSFVCHGNIQSGSPMFFAEAKSWRDAQNHCRGLSSDLISIHSAEENEAVRVVSMSQTVWTGLFKDPWTWSNGQSSYRNWKPQQPNYLQGQDCVVVVSNDGRWNDLKCTGRRNFICCSARKPIPSTTQQTGAHTTRTTTAGPNTSSKGVTTAATSTPTPTSNSTSTPTSTSSSSSTPTPTSSSTPTSTSSSSSTSSSTSSPNPTSTSTSTSTPTSTSSSTPTFSSTSTSSSTSSPTYIYSSASTSSPNYSSTSSPTYIYSSASTSSPNYSSTSSPNYSSIYSSDSTSDSISTNATVNFTTASGLTTPNITHIVSSAATNTELMSTWTTSQPTPTPTVQVTTNGSAKSPEGHLPPGNLILIQENLTWIEAMSYCREHHIDLVHVTTKYIQEKVAEKAKNATSPHVWVGLRYTCKFNFWFWTSSARGCYVNWAPGQGPERNYGCGVTGAIEATGGQQWVGLAETEKLNFICYECVGKSR